MLLIQIPVSGFGAFADRYGVPLLALGVFILFFWRLFWPLFVKAQTALEQQVIEARAARERDTTSFLASLAARDDVNKKQTSAIDALADRIDNLRERPHP